MQYLILLLVLFSYTAAASCPASLRLAYNSSWLPYVKVEAEQVSGQDVELLRQTLARLQLQIKPLRVLESRALQLLELGQVDVVMAASFTSERAHYAHFSLPYRQEISRVMVHQQSLRRWPALTQPEQFFQLARSTLIGAFNPKGYYGKAFQAIQQDKQLAKRNLPVYESDRRFELVQNQRVHYAVMEQTEVEVAMASETASVQLQLLPFVLDQAPVHFMLSKVTVSDDCLQAFNQALQAQLNDQAENASQRPVGSRH